MDCISELMLPTVLASSCTSFMALFFISLTMASGTPKIEDD
jgi:hypothetical protein